MVSFGDVDDDSLSSLTILAALFASLFVYRFINPNDDDDGARRKHQQGKPAALRKITKASSSSPKVVTNNSQTTDRGATLIIDGCNGPIRMNQALWKDPNIDLQSIISLLRVSDGETSKTNERLDAIPALDRQQQFHNVRIIFDGMGNKSNQRKSWKSPDSRVRIEVTGLYDEADNAIVDDVSAMQKHKAESVIPSSAPSSTRSSDHQARIHFERSDLNGMLEWSQREPSEAAKEVFRVMRTADGPGKQRQSLKPLMLLRPLSGSCQFAFTKKLANAAKQSVLRLQSCEKIISVEHITLKDSTDMVVVATDDIFLRERILAENGFVMSFEQLWTFLVEFSSTGTTK